MKTAADWANEALAKQAKLRPTKSFDAIVEVTAIMQSALQRIAANDPLPKLAAEAAEWALHTGKPASHRIGEAMALMDRLAAHHKTNGPGEHSQQVDRVAPDAAAGSSPAPTFNTNELGRMSPDEVRAIVREEMNTQRMDPEAQKIMGRGCAWASVIIALAFAITAFAGYWKAVAQ